MKKLLIFLGIFWYTAKIHDITILLNFISDGHPIHDSFLRDVFSLLNKSGVLAKMSSQNWVSEKKPQIDHAFVYKTKTLHTDTQK